MGSPAGDLSELERQLREAMQAAARAYREAVAEHRSMVAEYKDLLNHPDGTFAVRTASAHERLALEKYARAVKLYADLMVRGQKPE